MRTGDILYLCSLMYKTADNTFFETILDFYYQVIFLLLRIEIMKKLTAFNPVTNISASHNFPLNPIPDVVSSRTSKKSSLVRLRNKKKIWKKCVKLLSWFLPKLIAWLKWWKEDHFHGIPTPNSFLNYFWLNLTSVTWFFFPLPLLLCLFKFGCLPR